MPRWVFGLIWFAIFSFAWVANGFASEAPNDVFVRVTSGRDGAETVARLVARRGKVVGWDRVAKAFRVELHPSVSRDAFRLEVLGRNPGAEVLPASPRTPAGTLDMQSVAAIRLHLRELKAARAHDRDGDEMWLDERGRMVRMETGEGAKVDFLEAYLYYIERRAFPYDSVDWSAYERAREHRDQMQPGKVGREPYGTASPKGKWVFLGPTNLDQPYRIYYGPRPMNGRVNALAVDPVDGNVIYLGGAFGGLWRTTDNGATWQPLGDQWDVLMVNSITIDPTNRDVIYVGLGDFNAYGGYSGGLMKTIDRGATFVNIGKAQFGSNAVRRVLVDPENSQIVTVVSGRGPAGNGKVWRSTDGGQTWTDVIPTLAQWSDAEIGAKDGQGNRYYYAVGGSGGGGQVWRSSDRGATWTQLTSPVSGNQNPLDIAVSPTDPATIYLLSTSSQQIFKSVNAGASWTNITGNFPGGYNWSQGWYDFHISCSTRVSGNQNIDVVYIGLIDIVQSRDAGATWRSVGGPTYSNNAITHNDQHCLAVDPSNPNRIILGNDGGVYRLDYNPTNDTWTITGLSKNLGITQFYAAAFHPTDPNQMLGGTQDNASPLSTGDLANWANVGGGDGGYCAINPVNPNIQYATSQGLYLYRTENKWATTDYGINPDFGSDRRAFIACIYLPPTDPDRLYACTNYLWRWTDSTRTWEPRLGNQQLAPSGTVSCVAVSPTDKTRIYAGTSGGLVWMSSDDGATWTQIHTGSPGLPTRFVTSISINPVNHNDIVVGLSGTGAPHLWRCTNTTNPTRVWQDVSGSGGNALPDIPLNCIARDLDLPQTVWYVGTDIGAFMTTDAGATWQNITEPLGLPNTEVDAIVAMPGTRYLFVATFGRGMWRIPLLNSVLDGFQVFPSNVIGGLPATGTVVLDQPAPVGGTTVDLESSNPAVAKPPATVTVPASQTSATFPINTTAVAASQPVVIAAFQGSIRLERTLNVVPPPVSVLSVNPWRLTGGTSTTGTVHLAAPAPSGGIVVQLQSSRPEVSVPSTVTIAGGAKSRSFSIGTQKVPAQITATLTATTGEGAATAQVVVDPARLESVSVLPRYVKGGRRVTMIVKLSAPAPTGGVTIALATDRPSVTVLPQSVKVKAGDRFVRVSVLTKKVSSPAVAELAATLDGQTKTAKVTVRR